ncbi:MAG: hypothetical protein A2W09_00835 [Deltaproteobacteria bacterium RBG_16_50_11]|nr:MAG: hypothetical protein A2W09_00835 [Deltaproteobacteria bacterium RBG_16_50_11]
MVVRGHQIKSSQPSAIDMAEGLGLSGESASHRFSRKNILSQRPLRLERVTPWRDEWAVRKGFEAPGKAAAVGHLTK